jgi:hypothetical protein
MDLNVNYIPEPPKHTPPLDLALSKDGKRNAYYLRCVPGQNGGCASYAACLDKIARKEADTLPTQSPCHEPIAKGRCLAIDLREKEIAAGHSLYFIERLRHGAIAALVDKAKQLFGPKAPVPSNVDITGNGTVSVDVNALVKSPKVQQQVAAAARIESDYMAQALNVMMKDHTEKPAEEPLVKPAQEIPAPLPGETTLQAARRLLAAKNAKSSSL